jgi:chitobiase/beta-hexosaminidase-like protein
MRVVSCSAGPRCTPAFNAGPSEGRHTSGAVRKLLSLVALAVLGLAALAGSASAAPTGSHVIATLADSSGLELSGYSDVAPQTAVNVNLVRNGVVVGQGTSVIDIAGDGVLNGGTADCWVGVTPDILPGDTVEVSGDTNAAVPVHFDDTMVVQDTHADAPVSAGPGSSNVLVTGHATGPNGAALPAGGIVGTRIITGAGALFTDARSSANGRQLRAGSGDPFPLTIDAAGNFTATYNNLLAGDLATALNPLETRAVFSNAAANEVTISQNPPARGPAAPCTAPLAQTAISGSTPKTLNKAFFAAGNPATISGVATADVTNVSVSVPGGAAHTAVPAAGTWSVQVPASELAARPDGNVAVTAAFTSANPGTPASGTMTLLKDTVAPGAPVGSPPPGKYQGIQSVTLSDNDPTAAIHYTTSGATPTASSTTSQPITLTASRTIKAIAIDAAGNSSGIAALAYTIFQPPPPPQPQPGPVGGSTGPITVFPVAPVSPSRDLRAPRLRLSLPGGGALLTRNKIAITLRADENALVSIRGTIGKRSSHSLFKLKRISRTFRRGRTVKVKLTVPLPALAAVQQALAQNRAVIVNLTIKAVDAAGNARTLTRSFRLSG